MKNITKILLTPLFLSAFTMIISFGGQKTEWKGKIEKRDVIMVIKNPKEPMYDEHVFIIEDELSFGDDEEDENSMLA